MLEWPLYLILALLLLNFFMSLYLLNKTKDQSHGHTKLETLYQSLRDENHQLLQNFQNFRTDIDKQQINAITTLQNTLQLSSKDIREQINLTLNQNTLLLRDQFETLTQNTNDQLNKISASVEKRLSDGFEKTNATFTDVIKRLALIDRAQHEIAALSTNIVSLQEILSDKQARGAFGEVQLSGIIRNLLAETDFTFQHTLSNHKRADCILWLPEPTGNVVIDAKFPLENYRKYIDNTLSEQEKRIHEAAFRQDVKMHIRDIAEKYILPGETADGALMFIPAEAIFADLHAKFPEIITLSQQAHVWIVSPTTLMAVLTTARAVLKDAATRKQIHIIQEHLAYLAKDFMRFQKRMDNLKTHINQAQQDISDASISANKITSRFEKIEKVELENTLRIEPVIEVASVE